MNKQEYQDYTERFEAGIKGMEALSSGYCHGCDECGDNTEPEPYFSSRECDICGSWATTEYGDRIQLAGDREPAHYIHSYKGRKSIVHLEVCQDCVYFMEYGQLDDMTMQEVNQDA